MKSAILMGLTVASCLVGCGQGSTVEPLASTNEAVGVPLKGGSTPSSSSKPSATPAATPAAKTSTMPTATPTATPSTPPPTLDSCTQQAQSCMGIDASQDAITACMAQVQACFASLTPSFDAGALPTFPDGGLPPFSFDAGLPPFSFDAGLPPFSFDAGLPPFSFPDSGLPPFSFPDAASFQPPPFPDGGLQPPAFPDAGFPSSACLAKLNACASSKDPQTCFAQAQSCLQGGM